MVLFYTHVLLGIITFLLAKDYFSGGSMVVFFLMLLLGSILPDIDESSSKISKWSGILGKFISFFSTHRGFYHSIFFFVLSFIAVSYLWLNYYAWALLLGFTAHIVGDMITPMGVQIFYPFFKFKIKGPIKTGSVAELLIFVLLIALTLKLFL